MTTERISSTRAGFVDDSSRRPCRWCGAMPDGRRRTFCSDACVHQHKLRTDPAYQARHVLKRDRGVCESCGLDCVALVAELEGERLRIGREITAVQRYRCLTEYPYEHGTCGHEQCRDRMASDWIRYTDTGRRAWAEYLLGRGIPPSMMRRNRLWEMDHRVPVVEGGGDCGLENLRTLCWACHRRETAALAGRRAAARKAAVKERDPRDAMFKEDGPK